METFPGWVGVRTRRTCGSFAGQSGRGLNVQDWEAEGENGKGPRWERAGGGAPVCRSRKGRREKGERLWPKLARLKCLYFFQQARGSL